MSDKQWTGERARAAWEPAEEDLLDLKDGERPWKLYVFRPAAGRATRLEHKIYTKQKPDGRLAMVTFAVHTPAGAQAVRSGIVRVPDLSRADLERIIQSIREQTHAAPDEFEEIELSGGREVGEWLE